jgi:hypothetical protein
MKKLFCQLKKKKKIDVVSGRKNAVQWLRRRQ